MKIAIVGTGIAGLGAAHRLQAHHDITVYEAASAAGGHSRTIEIRDGAKDLPVDTGFIVFNKRNYPLLTRLFESLAVPIVESDMSFGASIRSGWLEYGSKGMFAQTENLIRPAFWGMLRDILRFNRTALPYVKNHPGLTLGECLDALKLGDWFCRYYLEAMGAAIWSTSTENIRSFPALALLQFFENHGLLTLNDHPQWYTVEGGSREYVARLTAAFRERIKLSCGVQSILKTSKGVEIIDTRGETASFDHIVLACHADQALKLLEQPSTAERRILSAFQYTQNSVITHSDVSFMPKRKGCWASWVYLSEATRDQNPVVSLSYWMNQLQKFPSQKPVFVTLNPGRRPRADLIHDEVEFHHPLFTKQTLAAQNAMNEIQNIDHISYCGAYQGYGFHEDGLASAYRVAETLGVGPT